MSLLGEIRRRSTLLLLVIGVAMLAFILGDFMQSQRTGSSGGIFVGEVHGEEISIQSFQERVQKGTENWKNQNQNSKLTQNTLSQIRNSIWDEYVKELVMYPEFEQLGIDVGSEELFELFQGDNVHSEISKIPVFQDPNTNVFDRSRAIEYMKNLENDQTGEAQQQWIEFENYIRNIRRSEKYENLVQQSLYVSSREAMRSFNEGSSNISINYISIPFSSYPDTLIHISDDDIEECYESNLEDFKQKESRDVDYVVFAVTPSQKDDENTKNNLKNLVQDFKSYSDFKVFAKRNSDNYNTYSFQKKNEIIDTNSLILFNSDINTVIGPYKLDNITYRVAKLVDIQYRPDSLEARHILLSPSETIDQDSIRNRIKEFKVRIENGEDFSKLAEEYSVDKGSAIKGGSLGWLREGETVPEFNDTCFSAQVGQLYISETQFGVHLIEVIKRSKKVKKVKLAYIDRLIEPSSETYHMYYTEAAQFAGALISSDTISFNDLAERKGLVKRNEVNVLPSKQNISGLDNSREMIRWMQNADLNDVSEVFEFEDNYVVASLKKVNKEGAIPLNEITDEIRSKVMSKKKGEAIIKNIESMKYNSISELAEKMNVELRNASKLTFSASYIENIGSEPGLLGIIYNSNIEEITIPIAGNYGVFVAKVISRNQKKNSGDFSQQKEQIEKTIRSRVPNEVYDALKEKSGVIDNRNEFY